MAGYIGSKTVSLSTTAANVDGNITVTGNVDGRDVSVDGTKLDTIPVISTSSVPSFTAKSDGTTDGYIQLNCSANSHGIKFKSPPHSAGASYTLVFPTTAGNSGQFLKTDGSGNLSWGTDATLDNTKLPLAGGAMTGAITTNSTFDGRNVSSDGTKLDGIEDLATADQTDAQIKTAVQNSSDISLAGNPTTTTQSASNNSTRIATTAYTDAAITALVNSAPATLDTLNELASALGDDPNYAATTTTLIGTKLPKAGGTMTGALTTTGQTINNAGQSQSALSIGGGSTNAALTLRGSTGSAYAWQVSSNAHVASALEFTRSTAVGGTTFSTPSMVINSNGNVGIGTSSPSAPLDLHVNASAAYSGSSEVREDFIIHNINGTDNSGVNNHATLGFHVANGATSQGFLNYVRTANNLGAFTFSQRTSSSNYAEHLRIDSSGNVGINETEPAAPLDFGVTSNNQQVILLRQNGNSRTGFGLTNSFGVRVFAPHDVSSGSLFGVGKNNGTSYSGDLFTVQYTGNVGIGTTSPGGNLQIGNNWTVDATYGGSDLYIKDVSGAAAGDPHITNTSALPAIISSTSTNTNGPDKVGLVLHNDDTTAGTYSPMLLFTKRETTASPFKATMAGIWARSPTGNGSGTSWIDGELHLGTAGTGTNGVKSRMKIDRSGAVSMPFQPSFRAINNGAQISLQGTYFPFNVVSGAYNSFDIGNNFRTSSSGTNAYSYVCPVAGRYYFVATTICNTINTNGAWSILKNNAAVVNQHTTKTSNGWSALTITAVINCAANDYINIYVGSTALNVYAQDWAHFSGYLIG